jgi:tRNA-dependent cyclodipeptide synthase
MDINIFNSNLEEIKKKNFNIFIGISVGVKPLNEEIVKEYLTWCLKNTNNEIIVLIADEIAKFNYMVFSSYNEKKSLNRAIRDGENHKDIFKNTISKYFKKEKDRIRIITWKDIKTDSYLKSKEIIKTHYLENKEFKKEIHFFLEQYTKRKEKKLSNEKLEILSEYIISELPTILDGIEIENSKYNLLFYPTYIHSGLSEMVEQIHKGFKYKELEKKLDIKTPTCLVEAYIKE